jgi:hypothetical protein
MGLVVAKHFLAAGLIRALPASIEQSKQSMRQFYLLPSLSRCQLGTVCQLFLFHQVELETGSIPSPIMNQTRIPGILVTL